jgi:adenylate kinase family enzyme
MRRIAVVGNSGSGKTSLAHRLAERLGVPHVELDAIHHQADWVPLPPEVFRSVVGSALAGDGWVVDGNYGEVRDLVWGRADTLVWLDLPRRIVVRRVVLRTVVRAVLRRELWNGNREPIRDVLRLDDPERSIVRWSWSQHGPYRQRYAALTADPTWSHLEVVRLRSAREVSRWLVTVPAA